AGARSVGRGLDAKPVGTRLLDRRGVRAQPHHYVHTRVAQVERMRVALGAVAEDRDGLAVELGEVCVLVVDHAAGGYRAAHIVRPWLRRSSCAISPTRRTSANAPDPTCCARSFPASRATCGACSNGMAGTSRRRRATP